MSTVSVFDIEVPLHDYLTGHEWEKVELLLADMPTSDTRANVLTFKIFVDSRTDQTLDVDAIMNEPIPSTELHEANEALLRPFVNARKERAEKSLKTQASHLDTNALKERRQSLVNAIQAIDEALLQRDGAASKASSSTTTPASASKGGKRGRSKKSSN